MKEKLTTMRLGEGLEQDKTDWKRLRSMTEEELEAAIDADPDTERITDEMWAKAKVVIPKQKVSIHLRVDNDIFDFFKKESEGRGHLTLMNAVLRRYMEAQKEKRVVVEE